jgi:CTP-dependent riboflavin kinase
LYLLLQEYNIKVLEEMLSNDNCSTLIEEEKNENRVLVNGLDITKGKEDFLKLISTLKSADSSSVCYVQMIDIKSYPALLSKEEQTNEKLVLNQLELMGLDTFWDRLLLEIRVESHGTSKNDRNYERAREILNKMRVGIEEVFSSLEESIKKIFHLQPTTTFFEDYLDGCLNNQENFKVELEKLVRQLGSTDTKQKLTLKKIEYVSTQTLKQLHEISMLLSWESIVFNSRIIASQTSIDFITKTIEEKENKVVKCARILYRGSDHDFCSQKFHSKCDLKTNLLILIRSSYKKIFGGYTGSTPYPSTLNASIYSSKSFLFSFDHKEIYDNDGNGKILYEFGKGPQFGNDLGHEVLSVGVECARKYSGINKEPGFNFGKRNIRKIVSDGKSDRFRVEEYEVWQIITNK